MAQSKERVVQRRQLGGHNVSDEVIEYNYSEGLRQTVANLPLFDNLTFIDGTTTYGQIVAIYVSASHHFLLSEPRPQWFDKHFARPLQEIVEAGKISPPFPCKFR